MKKKSIETGNIFHLGTKFSEPLGLMYMNEKEEKVPVYMGSYGLGPTRLMGTLVEVLSDDKGIVWPASVAPFQVHLLSLGANEKTEEIYNEMTAQGIEVLYDDRDKGAGEKFADADLMGMPYQVIIGKRSLESGKAEVKNRQTSEISEVAFTDLAQYFSK